METDTVDGNIDLIFSELDFGKFQVLSTFFIMAAIFFDGITTNVFIFTARDTQYRCRITECEDADAKYDASWLHKAIPLDEESELDKCARYPINGSLWNLTENSCSSLDFNRNTAIGCDEWVYGRGDTIVREFDLPCQSWKYPFVGTMNGLGAFVSFIFVGLLSDKFGRKWLMIYSLFIKGIIGVGQAFAPEYWSFTILEFLNSALTSGAYSAAYILGAEAFSAKHRVVGTMMISMFCPISNIALGFIAMWLEYWRTLQLAVHVPSVLFISCMAAIPESIRWLIIRRRYSDATAVIEKAARYNNIKFTEQARKYIESLHTETVTHNIDEKIENVPFVAIFRSRRLTLRLVVCSFSWIINVLIYNALSINSVEIESDNESINYILVASTEIASLFVYFFVVDRFGRKTCLATSLALCAIVCGGHALTPRDMDVLRLVLYLASKLFISFSYNVLYIYTTELFPTTLRHTCFACCAMIGCVGNILAPQTALMSDWHSSLPMSLFAVVSIAAGLSTLIFPETYNKKLPETIFEAENMTELPKKQ